MMKLFKKILYVAEMSTAQEATMARAVSLAENNQADLTVMSVLPEITTDMAVFSNELTLIELQAMMINKQREALDTLIAPYTLTRNIQIEIRTGSMFFEVIRAVLQNQYDLVLKPAENPDFISRLFGGDDMHLLRKCPCPVWLTGPVEKANYKYILVAVDFNADKMFDSSDQSFNQHILDLASSLALSDFAQLHLIHVWDAPAEMMVRSWSNRPDETGMTYVDGERLRYEKALDHLRDQLKTQIGKVAYDHLTPQFHLQRGIPSKVIPEMAKQLQIDLVVMGTVARTGIAGLIIGNTAEMILEQLQCAVLAVKPFGFVSPVKSPE